MYSRAIKNKLSGLWTIVSNASGIVQFSSLSRKLCNEWHDANTLKEPTQTAAYGLNASAGMAVWRAREGS